MNLDVVRVSVTVPVVGFLRILLSVVRLITRLIAVNVIRITKSLRIDNYSNEQILEFADEMNALPRKQLEYAIPEELFDSFLDAVYSNAENSAT